MKNKAYINIESLKENIMKVKSRYNYKYYILNVSNDAFYHGMEVIKYVGGYFQYLYTNNFKDVLRIRKYNYDIKIIYNGEIDENNIYDLILNNAQLVIKDKETLDYILSLKIKDKFEIILGIDKDGFNGFSRRHEIQDLIEDIKNDVHINISGVIAYVKEKDYLDFKYLTQDLKGMELVILNNEEDKDKIKMSNAIILDVSIYGINTWKRKLWQKDTFFFKPALEVYSYIKKIKTVRAGKKEQIIGVIPLGFISGINKRIKSVYINGSFYEIIDIKREYTLVLIDNKVKSLDKVEIWGANNKVYALEKQDIFNNLYIITADMEVVYQEN